MSTKCCKFCEEYKADGTGYGDFYCSNENCPHCHAKEPQQQSWEKDFDDRFPILMLAAKNIDGLGYNVIERRPLVKDFIREVEKEAYERGIQVGIVSCEGCKQQSEEFLKSHAQEATLQERTRIVKLVEESFVPHYYASSSSVEELLVNPRLKMIIEKILSTNENGV